MDTTEIKGATQIRDAICAHADWRRKLSDGIDKGQLEKTSAEISCNDKCAFGQWLSKLNPKVGDPAMGKFEMIDRLHTRFHQEAGKIAVEVEKGDREAARAIYESEHFKRMTNSLILNLNDWRQEFKGFMRT